MKNNLSNKFLKIKEDGNNLIDIQQVGQGVTLSNSHENMIINDIIQNIAIAEEIYIMVAFLTSNGLAGIINAIKESKTLEKGKIIFTTEGFITDKACFDQFDILKSFNIETRIFEEYDSSLHLKSYIFNIGNDCSISTGSANLTYAAFHKKEELHIVTVEQTESNLYIDHLKIFNNL